MIRHDLHRRITEDGVPANRVPLDPGSQKDPIRVPDDLVILNSVIGIGGGNQADAEVAPLGRVPVSAYPVRTEPVVACAPGQSYTAARVSKTPVADRYISLQEVIYRATGDENAREAVPRCRHAADGGRTGVIQNDTEAAKALYGPGSSNHDAALADNLDSRLIAVGPAGAASRLGIRLSRDRETVQIESGAGDHRKRILNDDAGCTGNLTRYITHQFAVIENGQSRGDRAADLGGRRLTGTH
jgi:hypothetical protein